MSVWGEPQRPSNFGPNVTVSSVGSMFTPSFGIEVATQRANESSISVRGVLPRVSERVQLNTSRTIHKSRIELIVKKVFPEDGYATVSVRLLNISGDQSQPIMTGSVADVPNTSLPGGTTPINGIDGPGGRLDQRPGYILINQVRVETGPDGRAVANISIPESGRITAYYHSGDWLSVSPAYTESRDTVVISPADLVTGGWYYYFERVLWILLLVVILRVMFRNLLSIIEQF
jgi:hypothetical protein